MSDAWYSKEGPENDIVLSTRVRLARNLVNYSFPQKFSDIESDQVQTLLFDAFSHLNQPDQYQALGIKYLEPLGQKILVERGVLPPDQVQSGKGGIVVRTDGRLSCTVNHIDHLRLSAFMPGLDAVGAWYLASSIDGCLQEFVQMAASVEFGYLTTQLSDLGTGMKISFFVHLPSLGALGKTSFLFQDIERNGISVSNCFGPGKQSGTSLGSFYQISSRTALGGTEETQRLRISNRVMELVDLERTAMAEVKEKMPTILKDSVYKAFAYIKYSRFLEFGESVDLISRLKWGLHTGIIRGVTDCDISGLLYKIQNAHILFVSNSGNFHFENDVQSDEIKIQRLRSLILQEAIEQVEII